MYQLLSFLFISIILFSLQAQPNHSKELKPKLAALSVASLDLSVKWYSENLGFVETARYKFETDKMRLAFLEKEGFELELIEIEDTPPFAAPDPENPATRRGIVKLGFYTDAIDSLYNNVIKNGTNIKSELKKSNRTGGRFFILIDPDGNWIQVFGPMTTN